MKTTCLFILSFLTLAYAKSQEQSTKSINVYYNTFPVENYYGSTTLHLDDNISNWAIFNNSTISIGYQWQKKPNYFFEAELMPFRLSKSIFERMVKDESNAENWLREEYQFTIYNSTFRLSYVNVIGTKKITFLPGLAATGFYYHQRLEERLSPDIQSITDGGISVDFIPGVQYNFSSHIHFRFDAPLPLFHIAFERTKDTTLEPGKQMSDKIGLFFMERPGFFRLSMGCRI